MPSNAIDCINLDHSVNSDAMVAFFNSTVYKALLETWGRAEGGGALQLMTYEVSTVPILDVRKLDADIQAALSDAKDRLIDGEDAAQQEIDEIILRVLDIDISVEKFTDLYEAMVQRRISSGANAEVLVDDVDEFKGEVTKTFSRSGGESTDLSEFT